MTLREKINRANLKRFRFWFQLAAFALFVYGGFAGIDLGNKLPTFSCVFNSDGRGGVCYLGILQHDLDHPFDYFLGFGGAMFLISLAIFILWVLLFNKAWCGYACPLGTMQDWLTGLRTALGIRYAEYHWRDRKWIKSIKYILLLLLILIPIGLSNPIFGLGTLPDGMSMPFCKICPGRLLIPLTAGDYSQFYIDFSSTTAMIMTGLGVVIVGLFLVGAFVKKRFFCYFCPLSGFLYLFSRGALLKLKKEGGKCTRCGDCHRACDMDIAEIADDVSHSNLVTEDCTVCLKCVAACPEEGALKATFAGIPIFESTEEGFKKRMQSENESEHHDDAK
jgi:polyferredoxin